MASAARRENCIFLPSQYRDLHAKKYLKVIQSTKENVSTGDCTVLWHHFSHKKNSVVEQNPYDTIFVGKIHIFNIINKINKIMKIFGDVS